MRKPPHEHLTIFDRFAIGFGCAIAGAVVAFCVFLVVSLVTGTFSPRPLGFAVPITAFAIAGFILGPAAADVVGMLAQGIFASAAALTIWYGPWHQPDPGEFTFRPRSAAVFVLVVIALTVLFATR